MKILCDCGCGKALEAKEMKTYGYVHKKFYCPDCVAEVDKFVSERDGLHTDLAKQFEYKLTELKSSWKESHPDGMLPDEA